MVLQKRRQIIWFGHVSRHWKIPFDKVVLKLQGKKVALKGIGWTTFVNEPVCLPDPYSM